MRWLFDDDLIESVVSLTAMRKSSRFPAVQIARFHCERDHCYSVLDPDQRQAAFAAVHAEWFREWGFEQTLRKIVAQFHLLPAQLKLLAFRKARARSEEGAELYVNEDADRHGIVALLPQRFESREQIELLLFHELTHLQDMVDPVFGYSPDIARSGQTTVMQRLIRERYRLLWDITIDGRLNRAGLAVGSTALTRRGELDLAFSFWDETRRARLFTELWYGHAPRHEALLALAADPREVRATAQPTPGAPCPLCGFATFEWANPSSLGAAIEAAIRRQFPEWAPGQGACARCVEVYEASAQFPVPAGLLT